MSSVHQAEYLALCVLLRRIRHQPKILLCRNTGGHHWFFPTHTFVPNQGESPRVIFDRQMLEIFSLDSHRLVTSTLIPTFLSEGRSVRIIMHLADKEYAQIGSVAPVVARWVSIVDVKEGRLRLDGASTRVFTWLGEDAQQQYWFQ